MLLPIAAKIRKLARQLYADVYPNTDQFVYTNPDSGTGLLTLEKIFGRVDLKITKKTNLLLKKMMRRKSGIQYV